MKWVAFLSIPHIPFGNHWPLFNLSKKKAVKAVCISIETWRGREEEMHEVMHQVVYVYMYTELFKIRFATFVANTLPHI